MIKNKISPPKVDFGEDISRITYPSGKNACFIIYKNIGHRRLIDISVKVIVRIPGIVVWDKSLTQTFHLNTTSVNKFLLDKNIPTTTRITLEESDELLVSELIPKEIKNKIKEKTFALEELLKLSSKSYVSMFILGNDEVTGVRKMFESKQYSINDIRDGKFNRDTMLVKRQC